MFHLSTIRVMTKCRMVAYYLVVTGVVVVIIVITCIVIAGVVIYFYDASIVHCFKFILVELHKTAT